MDHFKKVIAFLKENIFTLIAFAVLSIFVGVWWFIMKEVAGFNGTEADPVVDLPDGVVQLAGLLGVTIATITASALGFTISEVKNDENIQFSAKNVGAELTTPTLLAILVYIGVAVAVFFTWIANEEVSPDVLSVFALSSIGWLVGSASVAFKTTTEA
jgi:hypothetical protein